MTLPKRPVLKTKKSPTCSPPWTTFPTNLSEKLSEITAEDFIIITCIFPPCPLTGGGQPDGPLKDALEKTFGSFSDLQNQLSGLAAGQFGSGWGWLSANRDGKLALSASANQDNPLMEGGGFVPILGIDVWEHAYYLKYKNLRADYIKAFFDVIDWKAVAANYENVMKG
jgi:superoxide dismutase